MSKTCTWKECELAATHPISGDAGVWAHLCRQHNIELETALAGGKAPVIMRAYIKAKGGAKQAAASMFGASDVEAVDHGK